ncbi:MAG TPA: 50S ribosomal protein L25 [Acidimicrobiales bacterium]|nr:50S ribosomal protein L25 [Acidimicrobiales bacterium]
MPEVKLTAETGRPVGSRASGRLRHAGKVPGVVYGHGNEPLPVAVDARELRGALSTEAGLNVLLDLHLGGRTTLAITKDVQRHPVRNVVTHVDFLVVSRDEVVTTDVPIALVGEATAVIKADGVLNQEIQALTVHSTPDRIPSHIEVDVSGMAVGDTIRVGELTLPEGVDTDVDPELPVVVGQPPQVTAADLMTEEEAAAAAEAAAEAEAAGEASAAVEAAAEAVEKAAEHPEAEGDQGQGQTE